MEQAVVYARYSSHNQTENSIEGQISAAQQYALQHDYEIIQIYADRAKTGTNDQREAFQQMLADAKHHKFTVIIVWKVDRFGRNREEITFNKYKCKKEGVRVEYVAEQLGTGTESVILESVLEGMAEYYSKQLGANVKRGKAEAKAKGRWNGGTVPFGYDVVDHRLVVNESQAKVVRTIFERFADGHTILEISRETELPEVRVSRILKNPKYIGQNAPRIVQNDLWDVCKRRKDINIKRRGTDAEKAQKYVLTSRLYCRCGAHMTGTSPADKYREYRYYSCAGHRAHNGCEMKYLSADMAEGTVLEGLRDALRDEEVVENIISGVMAEYDRYRNRISIDRTVDKEIKALDKKIENIMRAVEDGMDYADVRERLEELKKEKAELADEAVKLSKDEKAVVTPDMIREYLRAFSMNGDRRAVVEKYIDRVTWDGESFDIQLNICPDFRINKLMPGRVRVKAK